MHEGAIARGIIETVEKYSQNLKNISCIKVRIGRLHAVVKDALLFFFDAMKEGKMKDANLIVEEVAVRGRCKKCKGKFEIDEKLLFVCPLCGSVDIEILSGEEMDIVWIEGEKEEKNGENKDIEKNT